MEIAYKEDTAWVRDSFVPIGVAGLVLTGSFLGWLVYDIAAHGNFWGWGILGFMACCLLFLGFLSTCYRVVTINRARKTVSVSYRGAYGFKERHSLWARQSHEYGLDSFRRVLTTRQMVSREGGGGKVPVYFVVLEAKNGETVPFYQHGSEKVVTEAANKLAAFLSLPTRQGYSGPPPNP